MTDWPHYIWQGPLLPVAAMYLVLVVSNLLDRGRTR